jgi:hypothetical protein
MTESARDRSIAEMAAHAIYENALLEHWRPVDPATFFSQMTILECQVYDVQTIASSNPCLLVRWASLADGNQIRGRQHYYPNGTVFNYIGR